MKTLSYCMTIAAAFALATVVNVRAADTASPVLSVLSSATAVELPAKAAQLVAKADAKTAKQTTIDVVKAAVGLNPAAAAIIVGAIAQSSPEMAATAAATAVSLLPGQAVAIAQAAAAAAPKQAGKIVAAICRVLPTAYQKVAEAVAEVTPGEGKEILTGIASAIPTLKDSISVVLAGYKGAVPSVGEALDKVDRVKNSAATVTLALADNPAPATLSTAPAAPALPRGPSVGPPHIPISGTPTNNLNAGAGGELPPGSSHGYAAP